MTAAPTPADTLADWLRQQLDDDERDVRRLKNEQERQRQYEAEHPELYPPGASYRLLPEPVGEVFVLADITVKRAVIDLCMTEIENGTDGAVTATSVLHWLAQPYVGRAGWRNEWVVQ